MQSPTVGVEEDHDVEGRHLHIEGLGILEVLVPNLVGGFAELVHPMLCHLITGVDIK